jgi:hypothetical protein
VRGARGWRKKGGIVGRRSGVDGGGNGEERGARRLAAGWGRCAIKRGDVCCDGNPPGWIGLALTPARVVFQFSGLPILPFRHLWIGFD